MQGEGHRTVTYLESLTAYIFEVLKESDGKNL